jgi:hypothetical protein
LILVSDPREPGSSRVIGRVAFYVGREYVWARGVLVLVVAVHRSDARVLDREEEIGELQQTDTVEVAVLKPDGSGMLVASPITFTVPVGDADLL